MYQCIILLSRRLLSFIFKETGNVEISHYCVPIHLLGVNNFFLNNQLLVFCLIKNFLHLLFQVRHLICYM